MIGVFAIFALGSVLISLIGIRALNQLSDSMTQVVHVNVPRLKWAYSLRSDYRQAALRQQQFITADDKEEMETLEKQLHESNELIDKTFDLALKNASEEGSKLLSDSQEHYKHWWEKSLQSRKAKITGDTVKALHIISEMKQLRLAADQNFVKLIELNTQKMDAANEVTEETTVRSRYLLIFISLFSILCAITIATAVLRATSKAIQQVISELNAGSLQVSSASQQIASASEQLSQATNEQAASLEETAASVEEMNSMVAKNSENANSASSISGRSQDAVNQGKRVIEKMVESMNAINRSSDGMAEIVRVIEQIDKKTKVINEIVNKTELLSFNASVEAARAGEHGKGFAVVAEEVGNLARMSGSAAEEIGSLLEDSISKVNTMVAETKRNVETGSQVTLECGEVFEEVVQNVTSVSGMTTEIASASQEQANGCAEITKAMNQLDQMTQQNASTSEECATAAEELSAQAEMMKTSVFHLIQAINGGRQGAAPEASHQAAAPRVAGGATVLHMKAPKKATAPRTTTPAALKKASGDAPAYDSDGFRDV